MDRIAKLKEFLAADPNDSFLQHALALEYVKASEDAAAQDLFVNLLERDANYIGSYYHLVALLIRTGEKKAAVEWGRKGLLKARESGDNHAYNELRTLMDDLED